LAETLHLDEARWQIGRLDDPMSAALLGTVLLPGLDLLRGIGVCLLERFAVGKRQQRVRAYVKISVAIASEKADVVLAGDGHKSLAVVWCFRAHGWFGFLPDFLKSSETLSIFNSEYS
jgi:hypothetical protein